ncbi:MAG: DUF4136 domain-containing protein [Planctomycetota bacterium]
MLRASVSRQGSTCAWIALACLSLACSGTRVETQSTEGVQFGDSETYAWMVEDAERDEVLALRVRQAVDQQLRELGWQQVDPEEAEVLVSQRTAIEERVEYQDPYYDTFVAEKYEEGEITIWLFDARTKARLWRGTGAAKLRKVARAVGLNEHQYAAVPREERAWPIATIVRDILTELPR